MFFRIIAGVFCGAVLVVWMLGAPTAYAGRCIQKRRRKLFVYVMAALNCLFIPYGTLLGMFTFVVLSSAAPSWEFELTPAQ
jgi:MFS family permease